MENTINKTDSLSKNDLDKIANLLDARLAPLNKKYDDLIEVVATKDDLNNLRVELKTYIHEGVETIMDGMDSLSQDFVEKQRVDKLEGWTRQLARKVGVKLV